MLFTKIPLPPSTPHHSAPWLPSRPLPAPRRRAGLARLLLLALAGPIALHAQNGGPNAIPTRYVPGAPLATDRSMPLRDATGTEDQRLVQMRNAARQESMVSNAGKLLRLASELNAEVAAGSGKSLTPAQLRKVQQIEKLARKVRSEMAIAVGDSQDGPMPIQSLGLQ